MQGSGTVASRGIAVGNVFVYNKKNVEMPLRIGNAENEFQDFLKAKEIAREQLKQLSDKTKKEVSKKDAMIIDVQIVMMDDADFNQGVQELIYKGENAPQAVKIIGEKYCLQLSSIKDEYLKERAVDVYDISQRIVNILCGNEIAVVISEECVIVANDLTPSELIQMDKSKVLAFITKRGAINSHTAIIARGMGIPALINTEIEISKDINNSLIVVDAIDGKYYIEPCNEILLKIKNKQKIEIEKQKLLIKYTDKIAKTKTGKTINILANINEPENLKNVMESGADGVGLMRSEVLYAKKDILPTEDELVEIFKKMIDVLNGKIFVVRALDIGADKLINFINIKQEENPALGYRGIRIYKEYKEIILTQIRAIYRASFYGRIAIMFPMIIDLNEVNNLKHFCEQVKNQLISENVEVGNIKIGIMIETPAAALISDLLAKEVDFFSIGTNDLTQYTLAIDRQNSKLENYYDSHHRAIMDLIKLTIKNANLNNINVNICGELAGDTALTEEFIKMGVKGLSVSPNNILNIKKRVCESEI